ncbi:FAD-binding oxidoreductase [Lentibacter sp. XHP0401]|uniref:FAD-binding oxidoreductase n=1 Tax=Lentibacter sp. XHP0401 TaxID=2984334 RepID=UPI0021E6EE40|nr:FAD-binding oxidoreductase [Lentibacter sp. XHP0401]MCV2894218.1 FAD-binding oxidoreductase [Lentibacter sp. XHP0401]
MLDKLKVIVGDAHVLTGKDMARYSHDWSQEFSWTPLAVVRPANTADVSAIVKLASETNTPVVPVSGNTNLAAATTAEGALMISLERLNKIREIRPEAKLAIVEAGVILSTLREAVADHGLIFPLTFGAQGSAMIGGNLSTNAGGSNVLRYGNTRDLCLGLEVVLPSGEIMDIMSELHKDNSGYNLKHLFIGAEGTLGIITAAVLKLSPKPRAYATAMVAARSVTGALDLLNRLQAATGGSVEAFEYMPRPYIDIHMSTIQGGREPFDAPHDVNILLEVGATSEQGAALGEDGRPMVAIQLEDTLAALFEDGIIHDAVVAQNEAQRREMWARREAAAEVMFAQGPIINNDIAVPVDKVDAFITMADEAIKQADAQAYPLIVAHLGDGNVHYAVKAPNYSAAVKARTVEIVEECVLSFGGSFSAEHGIGTYKLPSMQRRKNKAALATMRAIKLALDPKSIMNPGKVIPE